MIVLILVAILVAIGCIYAAAYVTGSLPGSQPAQVASSCSTTTTTYPTQQFVLNVYNASSGQGKAKETALAFKTNHFNVGVISNDPYKMKLTGVGQIRFGPKGESNARLYVQKMVPTAQLAPDGRDDDSVDIVLGDAFPTIPTPSDTPVVPPPGC